MDEYQKKAVEMDINSPLFIQAGPGSGKTTVLIERVLHIMRHHQEVLLASSPPGILLLTFSQPAALEMKIRLTKLYNGTYPTNIKVHTFHSFGLYLTGQFYRKLNYTKYPSLTSKKEQIDILVTYIKQKESDKPVKDLRKQAIFYLNLFEKVNRECSDDAVNMLLHLDSTYEGIWQLYEWFKKDLIANDKMQFSDMIHNAITLLGDSDVLSTVNQLYPYVLSDEFQDTNSLQCSLLCKMSTPHTTIVGDKDQLIFEFQGASPLNFKRLRDHFAERKIVCNEVKLVHNYRSSAVIVDVCNRFIDAGRDEKKMMVAKGKHVPITLEESKKVMFMACYSESDEFECVLDSIRTLDKENNIDSKDVCVLYRTNAIGQDLKKYLKANAPELTVNVSKNSTNNDDTDEGNYSENSFKMMKDRLLLSINMNDNVRYLQHRPSNMNAVSERIFQKIESVQQQQRIVRTSLFQQLDAYIDATQGKKKGSSSEATFSASDKKDIKQWIRDIKALNNCIDIGEATLPEIICKALSIAYISDESDDDSDASSEFQKNIVRWAYNYQRVGVPLSDTIATFLHMVEEKIELGNGYLYPDDCGPAIPKKDRTSYRSSSASSSQSVIRKRVNLSTVHKAKGLEWKAVIVMRANEDLYGPERDRDSCNESSKNLLYVAMSRPTQVLVVTYLESSKAMQDGHRGGLAELMQPMLKVPGVRSLVYTSKRDKSSQCGTCGTATSTTTTSTSNYMMHTKSAVFQSATAVLRESQHSASSSISSSGSSGCGNMFAGRSSTASSSTASSSMSKGSISATYGHTSSSHTNSRNDSKHQQQPLISASFTTTTTSSSSSSGSTGGYQYHEKKQKLQ